MTSSISAPGPTGVVDSEGALGGSAPTPWTPVSRIATTQPWIWNSPVNVVGALGVALAPPSWTAASAPGRQSAAHSVGRPIVFRKQGSHRPEHVVVGNEQPGSDLRDVHVDVAERRIGLDIDCPEELAYTSQNSPHLE